MGKSQTGKNLPTGICQRSNGLYVARASINGVKIELYDRELASLKKRFELEKAKVVRNEYNVRSDLILNDWFVDEWFVIYKAPHLKDELNRHNYVRRYENTFGKLIGRKKLSLITEISVQEAANKLIDECGYGSKYVREALSSLKECLNAAISNNIINKNPCLNVSVKDDKLVSNRVVMSYEQQKLFMKFVDNRYYKELYKIMLSTGMRAGEITALSWDDVDFENNQIHIRYSMQTAYIKGKKIMNRTTPKTACSIRDIPMFDDVKDTLIAWKAKQDESKEKMGDRWRQPVEYPNLVFTTSLGSPVTRYILTSDINKVLQVIDKNEAFIAKSEGREPKKFPKIHPHSFRHTFATRCFEKGLEPLFIMNIMGHSNYETTISYTHVLKKVNDEQVKLAGSFIA